MRLGDDILRLLMWFSVNQTGDVGIPAVMFFDSKSGLDLSKSLTNISGKQSIISLITSSSKSIGGVSGREVGSERGDKPVILEIGCLSKRYKVSQVSASPRRRYLGLVCISRWSLESSGEHRHEGRGQESQCQRPETRLLP